MRFEVRKNFMRPLLLLTLFAIAQTAVRAAGEEKHHITFKAEDFGQYKLLFTREKSTDVISISNIVLRTLTDEEATAIRPADVCPPASNSYYTLGGRQTAHPSKGVHVKDAKKVVIR